MADFFQTGALATLHRLGRDELEKMEMRLESFTREAPMALVLPCHVRDLENPALEDIVDRLGEIRYLHHIVLGLDAADENQWCRASKLVSKLPQEVSVLWNDGPRIQNLLAELAANDLEVKASGKGRNLWLGLGCVLADDEVVNVVAHDCDILTYSRELLARLCYPVAHPNFGFDFCKGYSARFTDRLNGRVMRLLFTPLVWALESILGQQHFLTYLDTFRYPLAGEMSLAVDVARRIRVPGDWGVEVGLLSEVFRVAAPKSICQVELCERYDHKHQELSPEDSGKGLNKMAVDVVCCVFHTLASQGVKLDQGVFDTLLSAYGRKADDMLRFSAADADINSLDYNRHEETLAVSTFAKSIRLAALRYQQDPLAGSWIPSWDRVESALPGFAKKIKQACVDDRRQFLV